MKKSITRLDKRTPQSFIAAAEDFERFKVDELKRSRKIAWIICIICVAFAGVCAVGIVMSFALHTEPAPVILKVDNGTGNVEMLRSVKDHHDSYDDIVNKYWLTQYVRMCERYDWFTISVDYESCGLFAAPDVYKAYTTRVKDKNSPLNVLKDKGKIDIRILSIVLLDANTAQIRYTSQKLNGAGENPDGSPLQRWIATVVFEYHSVMMTEQQRLVNPLGFKVLSYHVDPESAEKQL
jgi:type IV secretion system protein VirB8